MSTVCNGSEVETEIRKDRELRPMGEITLRMSSTTARYPCAGEIPQGGQVAEVVLERSSNSSCTSDSLHVVSLHSLFSFCAANPISISSQFHYYLPG